MDALTREPVLAPPASRTRRWLVALLCVLVTIGLGAAIWCWPVAPPRGQGGAACARPIRSSRSCRRAAMKRDMPVWLDGLGTVQAFQTVTVKSHGRWAADRRRVHRGAGRPRRRRAGADRPSRLPGGARQRGGEKGAGRGDPRQCAAGSRALSETGGDQLRDPAAGGHREGDGRAVGGAGPPGPGADRYGADTIELYDDHRAAGRQGRHAAGRSRATSCTRPTRAGW